MLGFLVQTELVRAELLVRVKKVVDKAKEDWILV